MTLDSSLLVWIVIVVVVILAVALIVARRQKSTLDRTEIMRETREAVREAAQKAVQDVAPGAVQDATAAAVEAYRLQQEQLQQEQAAKRRDAAFRAKETKLSKIESLQAWRPKFVLFVLRLAEPIFEEWRVDRALLDQWAEERADVYIKQKPYILEIIRAVHADAQKAAEGFANQAQKSPREIARERAKSVTSSLGRNSECPYCGSQLDARAHLDHIVSVQRGGPSVPWNMVYACVPCNHAKRDLSLMEFVDGDYARQKGIRISDVAKRLRDLDKYVEVLR